MGVDSVVLSASRIATLADVSYGTPTDGQSLIYNAATSMWVPGIPAVAGVELVYAENVSGTTQVLAAGGNADVTNLSISVPISSRPVYIELSVKATVSAVTGTPSPTTQAASLLLYETTSGSTLFEGWSCPIPTATPTGFVMRGKVRIASSTAGVRTFKANVVATGTASNGYGITIANNSVARSWMAAFAA